MPITYGTTRWSPNKSSAIRERLPGKNDIGTLGEQARDADQAVSLIPRLQVVEVNNMAWQSPFVVKFPARPRAIFVQVQRADDQDALVGAAGTCDWQWIDGGVKVRNIAFLSFSNTNRYNFTFVGVG